MNSLHIKVYIREQKFSLVQMMFGHSFMAMALPQNQSQAQTSRQHRTKVNVSYLTVYSLKLEQIVPFILRMQTINFLTPIVHLLTAAVIQMVDLSTLTLSNTEHVATNQKQTLKVDIIHMFT